MPASNTIKAAHFDCQFGAAGDMLLAAMLNAGIDREQWLANTNKIALPPGSFQIRIESVRRCSISATKVEIDLANESGTIESQTAYNPTFPQRQDRQHREAHQHEEDHQHHQHHRLRAEQTERHLSQILEIINESGISQSAKDLSARIFQRLARAEAQVHGVPVEEIHFHEVGAVDAIIDIVGFAIAFDLAGIEQASVCALPLGGGVVKTAHGIFPVPAPAVLKLLEEAGAPSSRFEIDFECLTPTGAAILCEVGDFWGQAPQFLSIEASGYGAGTKDTKLWPNVCRVILGNAQKLEEPSRFDTEIIAVIEANIDDQSPQALAYAVEKILAAGALDALVVAATMKKGRSGHLLTVLCRPEEEAKFQEMILAETSSLGARSRQVRRLAAARRFSTVALEDGSQIRVKLACDRTGKIVNVQPEFEDLANYARQKDLSIKEAQKRALVAAMAIKAEEQ